MRLYVLAVVASILALSPAAADQTADVEAGEQVYADNCAQCHGEQLRNEGQAADLRQLGPGDRAKFDKAVQEGRGQMPTWKGVLSDEQLDQVWAYIMENAR